MAKETSLFVSYSASTGAKDLAVSKLTSSDARSHAAAVSRSRRDSRRSKLLQKPSPTAKEATIVDITPIDNQHIDEQYDDTSANATADAVEHNSLDRRQHMRAMQFSWRAASNGSSSMKLGRMKRMDPMANWSETPFGKSAIKYYYDVLMPSSSPIYGLFHVTDTYSTFYTVLMSHDGYRSAGVALAGALRQKASFPDERVSHEVHKSQASAITTFRNQYAEALANGHKAMDDISILTVATLAQLARFLGDMPSYKQHTNMIKEMVRQRGGLSALGHEGLCEAVLRQWDMFWTYEGAGDCLFPEARIQYQAVYPAFPLDTELRNTFLKIPCGFQNLVIKGLLSIPTIDVLGRASDFDSKNATTSPRQTYADFATACPCLMEPDDSRNCFEKQICLAVLLYCFNTFLPKRSITSLYAASRTELTRLLLKLDENAYASPEQEALFWSCAICMDSWRTSASDKTMFGDGHKLTPVISRLGAIVSQAQTSLRKFFLNQRFDSFVKSSLIEFTPI